MRVVNTINLFTSPFCTSVGYNQNSLHILTKIECLKEKPLKCLCGFIKVKGFLGSIVHQRICHPFRWANVSCASGGTETSHSASALSPSSFTSPSHSSLPRRSLLSPDQVLTSDISPPPLNQKHDSAFARWNSLHCLSHRVTLHHPAVVPQKATAGDTVPPGQMVFPANKVWVALGLLYTQNQKLETVDRITNRNVCGNRLSLPAQRDLVVFFFF